MRRIRLVVDTNIFVSAFLGSKNAKFLVKDILNDEYDLIMSEVQLREIKEVLMRPKFSEARGTGPLALFSIAPRNLSPWLTLDFIKIYCI